MDHLAALRLLITVADAASFTRAADKLGISRAMASRRVLELEARLGVRLINRTTRRVALTEVGAQYVERTRELIAGLEEAERQVTSQAAEPVGRLRISAPMSFGIGYAATAIEQFADQHPRIAVDLVLNDRFVDLVEEGYDVAIRIGRLTDSTLIARRIAATRLIVAAAPAYLAREGTPLIPADLAGRECLLYAYTAQREQWTFGEADTEVSVRVEGRILCNNSDAMANMAIAGIGLVRAPDFILGARIAAGQLVEVLAEFSGKPLGIYAVHASLAHVPLKVRAFVDFLGAYFAGRKDWCA